MLCFKEYKVIVDKIVEIRWEFDNIINVLMLLEDLSEKFKGDIVLNRCVIYVIEEVIFRIEFFKKL